MANKTPEEQLAEASARLAISQKYIARDEVIDPDPSRQEQLDRNRIPGQFGSEQLSAYSELEPQQRPGAQMGSPAASLNLGSGMAEVSGNLSRAVAQSLREQPRTTLVLAAAVGFALGAIWKA
ncbi:hypothetical protein [Hyphomicrobium sp.]|uniref:hypothetical protein n=1 Tax=Hyphomicrobium sp. TaxID=82 RepID=UPI002D78A82E|nr:hypothetical protein [Hyphomicrobium sp.]HET6389849.1 hypothetical protein [Hyphomicrobium sp.]